MTLTENRETYIFKQTRSLTWATTVIIVTTKGKQLYVNVMFFASILIKYKEELVSACCKMIVNI